MIRHSTWVEAMTLASQTRRSCQSIGGTTPKLADRAMPSACSCLAFFGARTARTNRKSTRLNSSHQIISYAVFCLKKKKKKEQSTQSGHNVELNAHSTHLLRSASADA